jgi:hypothetical protein
MKRILLWAAVLYIVPAFATTKHEDGSVTFTAQEMEVLKSINGNLRQHADQMQEENKHLRDELERVKRLVCL